MESSFLEDEEVNLRLATAKAFLAEGNHIKALQIFEDLILDHNVDENAWFLHLQQECFLQDPEASPVCAYTFFRLAVQIRSRFYYRKSLEKAKEALSVTVDELSLEEQSLMNGKNQAMKDLIKDIEFMISSHKDDLGSSVKSCEPEVWKSKKKSLDPVNNELKALRSFWLGLDIKIKRDFMKVDIEELSSFTEGLHNREGLETLEEILNSARKDRKWTFWMCRSLCAKKFSSAEECRKHLEQEHAADFKPSSEKDMVKRIGIKWAPKISAGAWEPVNAVAAVEMMKNPLTKAGTFKSHKGWSKEWPLAVDDEERSNLLEEIKSLLMLIHDHKILSCSIRNWLINFPIRYLEKLDVSKETLVDFHLVDTPQSICFLECHDLIHIRDILENINCERDDGTDLVCRAVGSFLSRTRVKEKIDFDPDFSVLLVDKRLLKSNCVPFDDEVTINVLDPDKHYANAQAKGDDIISWLVDDPSVDKIFPRPIREHNLDIWLAVLRAVQFTCRTLGTKYAQKVHVLGYEAALTVVENLCMREDDRRKNLPEDEWNSYASLLCDRCEQSVPGNSLSSKSLLCARPSTSMPRPLDKIVEHEPSVNLAPEGTSPSLEMVKEESVDPEEDTLASDNQEEASKVDHDMPKMHEEDSLPKHLDSALGEAVATYNSAFDMTLKALLNAKVLKEDLKHNGQPFHGEQVPCALRNHLLASLKEVNPMSSDAAEVGSCEEEHICLAYEKTRWFNLRRESFEGEVVGNWKNVVKFCEERKVRPEILLYEAAGSR
ncbi:hypothetical protein AALP_AA8G450500 [Arabis alpina]|uniref:C2H2-type domain-containing protein n=1 Tax=Arabis alpina TaxID=50452 RepID=A0A087GDI5_ARAAL|nr:hypothetical protein AALP_AA8G450500 [Arabis alpina]